MFDRANLRAWLTSFERLFDEITSEIYEFARRLVKIPFENAIPQCYHTIFEGNKLQNTRCNLSNAAQLNRIIPNFDLKI